jgi:hypothetical protein
MPCERLYRRALAKGLTLEWLQEHLQNGTLLDTHPDLCTIIKHGRPVTTCMSPDAEVAWSGDELDALKPQNGTSSGAAENRNISNGKAGDPAVPQSNAAPNVEQERGAKSIVLGHAKSLSFLPGRGGGGSHEPFMLVHAARLRLSCCGSSFWGNHFCLVSNH